MLTSTKCNNCGRRLDQYEYSFTCSICRAEQVLDELDEEDDEIVEDEEFGRPIREEDEC